MGFKTYDTDGSLSVGDVVGNEGDVYGRKLVAFTYVDDIAEYRWIVQEVTIEFNKVTPTRGGKELFILSGSQLQRQYTRRWLKDAFSFKKGDAFKGASGDHYLATSDGEVYSLRTGTWSTVTPEGVWAQYTVADKLTKLYRASGDAYSGKFN